MSTPLMEFFLAIPLAFQGNEAFSPVPGLPGWSFLMTYLRGKLAPSAVLLGCASEPGLPPQISHKKTAPSRQSLRKDLIPSFVYS